MSDHHDPTGPGPEPVEPIGQPVGERSQTGGVEPGAFQTGPGEGYQQPPVGAGAGAAAGLGKRIVARILDALIVGIPLAIVLGILGVRPGSLVYGVITGVAGFAYFVFLETSNGATLAKQLLSMRVVDASGGTISTDASARRNWWMLLSVVQGIPVIGWLASIASLVIVIIIIVTISSDPNNRGWHDKLGDTQVVERA
ncbi:MAG TPA: RDD family protein [Egibacteraceae bacterium]|nr:RDD family protein [Egibacteraceae bacterium]